MWINTCSTPDLKYQVSENGDKIKELKDKQKIVDVMNLILLHT
jgi:hypothetical protein